MTERKVDADELAKAKRKLESAEKRLEEVEKDSKNLVAIAEAKHEKAKCEANLAEVKFGPTSEQYQLALKDVKRTGDAYDKIIADAAGAFLCGMHINIASAHAVRALPQTRASFLFGLSHANRHE